MNHVGREKDDKSKGIGTTQGMNINKRGTEEEQSRK